MTDDPPFIGLAALAVTAAAATAGALTVAAGIVAVTAAHRAIRRVGRRGAG